jgi:hypothetical protein
VSYTVRIFTHRRTRSWCFTIVKIITAAAADSITVTSTVYTLIILTRHTAWSTRPILTSEFHLHAHHHPSQYSIHAQGYFWPWPFTVWYNFPDLSLSRLPLAVLSSFPSQTLLPTTLAISKHVQCPSLRNASQFIKRNPISFTDARIWCAKTSDSHLFSSVLRAMVQL